MKSREGGRKDVRPLTSPATDRAERAGLRRCFMRRTGGRIECCGGLRLAPPGEWSCGPVGGVSARISPADGPEQAPFAVPPDNTNRTAIWSAIWCLHRHLANDRDARWCKRVCGQRGGCMIAGVSSSHSLTFLACRLLCERRACRGWCLQVVRFLRIGRGPLSHRWTVGPLIALTRAPGRASTRWGPTGPPVIYSDLLTTDGPERHTAMASGDR